MKLQLILAGTYSTCKDTQDVWKTVCEENQLSLETFDIEKPEGEKLAAQLDVKSFPALIVDGKIKAVGHPEIEKARSLIKSILA